MSSTARYVFPGREFNEARCEALRRDHYGDSARPMIGIIGRVNVAGHAAGMPEDGCADVN
jgi:hypothetical protein